MDVGQTLDVSGRDQWRAWLSEHHRTEPEIWLVYHNKRSGRDRIPYNDAVEEALCFGWIDSTVKKLSADSFAQRFTPRGITSPVSEMNKERARRLIAQGKMTEAGLEVLGDLNVEVPQIPKDILTELLKDPGTWSNFQAFPDSYRRIRLAFVEGARNRPQMFRQRLDYLLKMTAQNKKFGMVQ